MGLFLADYRCPDCESIEERIEERGTPSVLCRTPDCGGTAERIISGTHAATVWGYAARRGVNEARPANAMNTESLADGQKYSEWKKARRSQRIDERRREIGIQPKVYV